MLDAHYLGLLTHIYTCPGLSQAPLAQAWGMRFFEYPAGQPKLSSINPYRLLSVHDHFGANARLDNPPAKIEERGTKTKVEGLSANARTERRGRPGASELATDVARPGTLR